ncbi:MAG: hypothetical protein ABI759_24905 [Candidatus Solibacter sp.]
MDHMLGCGPACFLFVPAVLLCITPGFAQAERAQAPPANERTAIAERYANEKLFAWQRRLNLADWSISIVVARSTDLKKNTVGNIKWDRDKKTALIRVLDPVDYKLPFEDVLRDIEFTVVHELIHLEMSPVLADLNRTDANRMEEEYAVNHMTEAFLKLDRGTK